MLRAADLRPFVLFAAVALAVSLPSVRNGFVYDDVPVLVEDARIHTLADWPRLLTEPYWRADLRDKLYRPFTDRVFRRELGRQRRPSGGLPPRQRPAARPRRRPRPRSRAPCDRPRAWTRRGAVVEFCRSRRLLLIEDAACAIGSAYKGQRIGSHGNIACFSFHPRKIITTGEGGMITTDDGGLAEKLRRFRHHGMSVSDLERHAADRVVNETYPEIGYNYRMTDIQAAIGIVQSG